MNYCFVSGAGTVADVMTPREKLVYCSPTDTLRRCREIMFQCKVRNLPVIEEVALSKEGQASSGQRWGPVHSFFSPTECFQVNRRRAYFQIQV